MTKITAIFLLAVLLSSCGPSESTTKSIYGGNASEIPAIALVMKSLANEFFVNRKRARKPIMLKTLKITN